MQELSCSGNAQLPVKDLRQLAILWDNLIGDRHHLPGTILPDEKPEINAFLGWSVRIQYRSRIDHSHKGHVVVYLRFQLKDFLFETRFPKPGTSIEGKEILNEFFHVNWLVSSLEVRRTITASSRKKDLTLSQSTDSSPVPDTSSYIWVTMEMASSSWLSTCWPKPAI